MVKLQLAMDTLDGPEAIGLRGATIDAVVVGRAITAQRDPAAAAERIARCLGETWPA